MFKCDCCGRILEPHEVRKEFCDSLNEVYIVCGYCGDECTDYEEEDDKDDD